MGSFESLEKPCVTLDQVIRRRARTHAGSALISYPNNETDFEDYTGVELERLTRLAAHKYAEALKKLDVTCLNGSSRVVAIVGISSLEYYMTFLALQRLGITSLFISPRLADQGFVHLLKETNCRAAVASGSSQESLSRVRKSAGLELAIIPMLDAAFFCSPTPVEQISPLDPVDDGDQQGFIIHSGGTTGLPKPVPLRSKAWLLQAANIAGRMPKVDTLSTLPLFHSFGLATLLRCLVNGRRLSILNANRPITASVVLSGLEKTSSQALVTVPYILKFITEVDGGVERMAQLKQVIAAGSAIPDDLGDLLVEAGTNIFHLYGQTESGALMEPSQDQWNWVTPLPDTEPFLKFEPVGESHYHLIVLSGLKAKVFSDRPDGSYATKDLFQRHPTDPRKWKFVARQDDIIVLVNGEKADPIPLEEAVGRNPNIRVAVAFGAQRDSLGMVVVLAERAIKMSRDEVLSSILPDLELSNSRVPAYAKISPEAIIVKEPGTHVPTTDKATVIRSLFIKMLAAEIDNYYATKEVAKTAEEPMSEAGVREVVRQAVREQLQLDGVTKCLTDESDFFSLGMDSLQATNVRARVLREIYLSGRTLATNVVFDQPNVELLTRHLLEVRGGLENRERSAETQALEMLQKYSDFTPCEPDTARSEKECVLLTGATGSIGCHILSSLLLREHVAKVYCLVRTGDQALALDRIQNALRNARLLSNLSTSQMVKVVALPCDLGDERLGLSQSTYDTVRASTTTIIHNAWSVNFNLNLQSFEPHSIRSTHHLLNLAIRSPLDPKPTFAFISSIAAVLRATPSPIHESRHPWRSVAAMGYGQSKWVAEEMCAAAAEKAGLHARVLRVGQVAGDTVHGIWNAAEAIPTTVQCARTIGALPAIEGVDEELAWLPVDTTAAAIVELALLDRVDAATVAAVPDFAVFHVSNERTLGWNRDFLPALRMCGLDFETVPQREWVRRLEGSSSDVEKNPALKLVEFFGKRYGTVSDEPEPVLDVTEARKLAPSLGEDTRVDKALVGKFLKYWMDEAWKCPIAN